MNEEIDWHSSHMGMIGLKQRHQAEGKGEVGAGGSKAPEGDLLVWLHAPKLCRCAFGTTIKFHSCLSGVQSQAAHPSV